MLIHHTARNITHNILCNFFVQKHGRTSQSIEKLQKSKHIGRLLGNMLNKKFPKFVKKILLLLMTFWNGNTGLPSCKFMVINFNCFIFAFEVMIQSSIIIIVCFTSITTLTCYIYFYVLYRSAADSPCY